jgi:hypothetical protein
VLERVLRKHFPDWSLLQLNTSMDLEKSFGPIYCRGIVKHGLSSFAVLGVNRHELQASIDAALTFGILWLDSCRNTHSGKLVVEGLKLFVPSGCSAVVRERMAHLNLFAAKWELYEIDERTDECTPLDVLDCGNVVTRLVRCPDEIDISQRFGGPVALVHSLMPEAEVAALSPAEISFRCHGLEFARSRLSAAPGQFSQHSGTRLRNRPRRARVRRSQPAGF